MRKLMNNELNRLSVDEFKDSEKTPIVVVLDNIRSLNNIGSVFRTSDAFVIEEINLCGITATPPHRDIQKTALGATESIKWEYYENTLDAINELKKKGYLIISIEQVRDSISLEKFNVQPAEKYAIVFGNEVKGVQQEIINISDYCVEIPQFGTKHSFNISVSAGIVLWELYKKIKLDIK
ncbi:MAG: RNA methyltransferase [Bacteroidetes bacterium GWA2_31_9b]|nr:MAG: RNA methyltransferase [Bacteroidetes bacterium GWA2_31_9b]